MSHLDMGTSKMIANLVWLNLTTEYIVFIVDGCTTKYAIETKDECGCFLSINVANPLFSGQSFKQYFEHLTFCPD